MHSTYVVKLSRAELERRRLDAARDLLAGVKQAKVAPSHHTTRASVSRWNKTLREKGIAALRGTTSSGRPSHLTEEQWAAVERALREGPSGGSEFPALMRFSRFRTVSSSMLSPAATRA